MNYTNREVLRRIKQYEMFLNSLDITTDNLQRERICDQLDKIEKQILLETNNEYEEEYMILLEKESKLIEEEKTKLRNLISLIDNRRLYLNDRKNKHMKITGSIVELTTFLGEDKLSEYKERLRIIEKYEENKRLQENIIGEMKNLDIKISEASRNVKANTRLNESLENKMIEKVGTSLEKLKLYALTDKKDEITRKQETLKYGLDMAKENLKSARALGDSTTILDCDNMLSEIMLEYSKYNEKLNIIKLIEIYEKKCIDYDELLSKREEIDEILKNITESEIYKLINDELSKQYNTIKLESNDIKTYDELKNERENKHKTLYDIEEENNSKEFKLVLSELIKNEERIKEEKIRIAKRNEYNERQKRIAEEQQIEASRVKRQRLIEEAKLKEQIESAERLKKIQNETVLSVKPKDEIAERHEETINKEQEKIPASLDEILSKTDDLFEQEDTKIDFVADMDKEDISQHEENIYDLLGNYEDIEKNDNDIPVVNDQLLEAFDDMNMSFPEMNKEDGEKLWKETI